VAEASVLVLVAVGVDQEFIHLGCDGIDHVGDERTPLELHQPLVLAAHAPAHAAGEYHGGDL